MCVVMIFSMHASRPGFYDRKWFMAWSLGQALVTLCDTDDKYTPTNIFKKNVTMVLLIHKYRTTKILSYKISWVYDYNKHTVNQP